MNAVAIPASAPAPSADRVNIYAPIHKAIRGLMFETLLGLGRMDLEDACEVAKALTQLRTLLMLCRNHVAHENGFVHPALERARPGAARSTANDHEEHLHSIQTLEQDMVLFEHAPAHERPLRAHALYLSLSHFVGENLIHMASEETANQAILSAAYTDEELLALDAAIVATLPPEEQALWLPWMIANARPAERVRMLSDIRATAPPEAFAGVMACAREVLSERDRYKLESALALA